MKKISDTEIFKMPKIFLIRQELQLQHEGLKELVKGVSTPVIPPQDTLSTWEKLSEVNFISDNKKGLTATFEEKFELQILPEKIKNGKIKFDFFRNCSISNYYKCLYFVGNHLKCQLKSLNLTPYDFQLDYPK